MINQSFTTPTNNFSRKSYSHHVQIVYQCSSIVNPVTTAQGSNLRVHKTVRDHFLTIFTRGTYLLGPLDRAFVMSRKSKSGTRRLGEWFRHNYVQNTDANSTGVLKTALDATSKPLFLLWVYLSPQIKRLSVTNWKVLLLNVNVSTYFLSTLNVC